MSIPTEFRIILKSFSLTGIIFFDTKANGKRKKKACDKIKSMLKLFVEILFVVLTIIAIYLNTFNGFESKITFKVTAITLDALLLLLRISFLLNKTNIVRTLSKLYIFNNGEGNVKCFSLRKYAFLACGWCFLFPLTLGIFSISWALMNMNKYLLSLNFRDHSSSKLEIYYIAFITGNTIMYMNHFLIFPGLVMTLLSFMYLSFLNTFQRFLEEIRLRLLKNFSKKEVSRALVVFAEAKNIHLDIENTMSFTSFLAYVLTFGKIMQVISSVVTNFMPNEEIMRFMHYYVILGWTIIWFLVLTLCGTQAKKSETFIKNMNQEVRTKNFVKEGEGQNCLMYGNLLSTCSDVELRFTAWGMFEVDKKLFLTVTGVLVTYGVLFATELSKIRN
ncbi:uncharacterized protein NPIL_116721 [Nephila pilipes]|uniref:Gustatory receptor n=1 Tax=Nephila pilipes TaxID=299642 RepID=A0A8X6K395_NEPPI|nr:uncharacterized protein NPIL_116721 [Nephila pilipes]